MIRSHLLDAFLGSAWYLHTEQYELISDLLEAHVLGQKAAWRNTDRAPLSFLFDDAAEPIDERANDQIINGIAVIDVRGLLAVHADQVNGECQPQGRSYAVIADQLAAAMADDEVHAVALRLETPGGSASGCQELYDAIRACSKPVHAYIRNYAYSAGMYLASACETITASSVSAGVGSIGTIMSFWDSSVAAEAQGFRKVVVRAGAYKALAQDGEPVSDLALAELQRGVDAYGAAFHDAVRAGRGLTDAQAEQVLNGRTFLAQEAIDLGLVDAIASFDSFLNAIAHQERPAMFNKNKTPTTQTAAGLDKATFGALAAKFPSAIATITALDAEGKPALAIENAILTEQLSDLSDQLSAAQAAIEAATADATAAATTHASALAEKDTQIAQLTDQLKNAGNWREQVSKTADPGSDATVVAATGDLSDAQLESEWKAMGQPARNEYVDSFEAYAYARRNPERSQASDHGPGPLDEPATDDSDTAAD